MAYWQGRNMFKGLLIMWENAYAVKNDTELNAQQDHKLHRTRQRRKNLSFSLEWTSSKDVSSPRMTEGLDSLGQMWALFKCKLCRLFGTGVSWSYLKALGFPEQWASVALLTEPEACLPVADGLVGGRALWTRDGVGVQEGWDISLLSVDVIKYSDQVQLRRGKGLFHLKHFHVTVQHEGSQGRNLEELDAETLAKSACWLTHAGSACLLSNLKTWVWFPGPTW